MENIIDLIYASALGCLDNEEQLIVSKYLDSKEGFNLPELGEFQNLTALLPSILSIEIPDPQLKDIIAKRLYGLNEEIREYRQKRNSSTMIPEEIKEEINSNEIENADENSETNEEQKPADDPIDNTFEFLKTPQIIEDTSTELNESESSDANITPKEDKFYSPNQEPEKFIPDNRSSQAIADENYKKAIVSGTKDLLRTKTTFPSPPAKSEKKNYSVIIWGGVLTNLILIGIILYFIMSSKTNNIYSEVEKLKKQVGSLNSQLISAQEVQKMLQSPDVQVINLKGTIINQNGFGKLFIGSEEGLGYIQFAQMPSLPDDRSLQLWVRGAGKVISLGIFQVSDNMGFYSFKIQSLPKTDNNNFLITEEPRKGSISPSNKVYLIGKLNY